MTAGSNDEWLTIKHLKSGKEREQANLNLTNDLKHCENLIKLDESSMIDFSKTKTKISSKWDNLYLKHSRKNVNNRRREARTSQNVKHHCESWPCWKSINRSDRMQEQFHEREKWNDINIDRILTIKSNQNNVNHFNRYLMEPLIESIRWVLREW